MRMGKPRGVWSETYTAGQTQSSVVTEVVVGGQLYQCSSTPLPGGVRGGVIMTKLKKFSTISIHMLFSLVQT